MKDTARLHKDPVKSAGFRVLRAPDVPSVLVELGYVSNKQDLQSLLSNTWRDHTADSMAQAIDGYFSTHVAGARAGATERFARYADRRPMCPNGLSLNKKPSDERNDRQGTLAGCGQYCHTGLARGAA